MVSVLVSRPEDELLLCCARTGRSPELAIRIRGLLRQVTDWEYLLRTAHAHGIAPLLYWHLDATCPEDVPEYAFERLRHHFHANSLHNLFLTGELLRLLNAFGARQIPAVPYKGLVLAASAYGNLALRQFIDLDIVVRRHDVPKAKELLASLGYRSPYQLTRAQETAFLGSQGEYILTHDARESMVELHWEIAEHFSFPLDSERTWRRLGQIPLGNNMVLTFSPEDTLLLLCAHGCKHLWERLAWICDIAELIRVCRDMRWRWVVAQASALGGERMLLLGLFLANDLLGAALPDEILQRVHADPAVKALARRIHERLFRESNSLAGLFEGAYFRPLHLKMMERFPDKIRYCVRTAVTPTIEDWKLLSLPNFLFPFYYVLRPTRLAGKYGLKLWERSL